MKQQEEILNVNLLREVLHASSKFHLSSVACIESSLEII